MVLNIWFEQKRKSQNIEEETMSAQNNLEKMIEKPYQHEKIPGHRK